MTFNNDEIEAIKGTLPALGQHVATAGIGGKAFNDLTRDEVLGLVAATVSGFRESFDAVLGSDVPF